MAGSGCPPGWDRTGSLMRTAGGSTPAGAGPLPHRFRGVGRRTTTAAGDGAPASAGSGCRATSGVRPGSPGAGRTGTPAGLLSGHADTSTDAAGPAGSWCRTPTSPTRFAAGQCRPPRTGSSCDRRTPCARSRPDRRAISRGTAAGTGATAGAASRPHDQERVGADALDRADLQVLDRPLNAVHPGEGQRAEDLGDHEQPQLVPETAGEELSVHAGATLDQDAGDP